MRGRRPSGPEYVDHLEGSATAKERLKVILETMTGRCRVQEACLRLSISEPRFHQLRTQCVEASLAGLEPQRPGRKPRTPSAAEEQVRLLQQQLAELEDELRHARAREEIALTLPRLVKDPDTRPAAAPPAAAVETGQQADAGQQKKTPPRETKRRRGRPPKNPASPPGKRKNT
jgi:hypothetical protein